MPDPQTSKEKERDMSAIYVKEGDTWNDKETGALMCCMSVSKRAEECSAKERLLRVARALNRVKKRFENSTITSEKVVEHPDFLVGIRGAFEALKEVEHLIA